MNTWRINLKTSAEADVDPREYCIKSGIVGIGWPVDLKKKSITAIQYEDKGTKKYYKSNGKGWWPAWNAFYYKLNIDDLVWTRTTSGVYYLGKIEGEWYYDSSKRAIEADVVNVRRCKWLKVGTVERVPGKIVNSFIPPRTLQRVYGEEIDKYSMNIFNKLSRKKYYTIKPVNNQNLYSLISTDDCEDAVAIYLQILHDYMVVPSSCKKDTLAYEYELINKKNGKTAVVQVKNGNVNINVKDFKNIDGDVYLLTTGGRVIGALKKNIKVISPNTLIKFIYEYKNFMPSKIRTWMEITSSN